MPYAFVLLVRYSEQRTLRYAPIRRKLRRLSPGRSRCRDFRLTLYVVGDILRIEVTDTRGQELPHPQQPSPEAESGRGLLLVEALAHRWGVTEGRFPRKTVWAELRCTPPELRF